MLADLQIGNGRGDGPKRTSSLVWTVRFHVKRFRLRWTAIKANKDHGPGLAKTFSSWIRGLGRRIDERMAPEVQAANPAETQNLPPRQAIAQPSFAAEEPKHETLSHR